MAASGWFTVGGLWLGAVLLWFRFGPRQAGHAWQAAGAKRFLIIFGIVALGLLWQIFIVGWLIPLGVGIYKVARK
jgi:hypothetical protein